MSGEIDSPKPRASSGTLVYDGDCQFCISSAKKLKPKLDKHNYGLATFSDPAIRDRFEMNSNEAPGEMKLILEGGEVLGGADAAIYLLRLSRWSFPLAHILRLPGFKGLAHIGYRIIAKNRHRLIKCDEETCSRDSGTSEK